MLVAFAIDQHVILHDRDDVLAADAKLAEGRLVRDLEPYRLPLQVAQRDPIFFAARFALLPVGLEAFRVARLDGPANVDVVLAVRAQRAIECPLADLIGFRLSSNPGLHRVVDEPQFVHHRW